MIVFVLQECFSIITTSKILAKILKHFVLWRFFKYFKADIAWTKYWKSIHFIKKERKSRLKEILYTVILYGNTCKVLSLSQNISTFREILDRKPI